MPVVRTADRVVVSVIATPSGDWEVVSTPTGYQGITADNFADNDIIHGMVEFENGADWEVYDGDDEAKLLEILNVAGTVTISRPAVPYKSSNGGARVAAGTGTHTMTITLGAASLARFFRETNSSWKTLPSGDATPSVADQRFFKTNGATTITRFDDMGIGQLFYIARGASDILIQNNASIQLADGQDMLLTAANPGAVFAELSGVAVQLFASGNTGRHRIVDTISEARAIAAANYRSTDVVEVRGQTTLGDGFVRRFTWDAASTVADDGLTVLTPSDSAGAGRLLAKEQDREIQFRSTFADMTNDTAHPILNDLDRFFVETGSAAQDGLSGLFTWDAASIATADDIDILSKDSLGVGRFLRNNPLLIHKTTAELADVGDPINTIGKYKGRGAFNTDLSLPVWASGALPADAWITGVSTVTTVVAEGGLEAGGHLLLDTTITLTANRTFAAGTKLEVTANGVIDLAGFDLLGTVDLKAERTQVFDYSGVGRVTGIIVATHYFPEWWGAAPTTAAAVAPAAGVATATANGFDYCVNYCDDNLLGPVDLAGDAAYWFNREVEKAISFTCPIIQGRGTRSSWIRGMGLMTADSALLKIKGGAGQQCGGAITGIGFEAEAGVWCIENADQTMLQMDNIYTGGAGHGIKLHSEAVSAFCEGTTVRHWVSKCDGKHLGVVKTSGNDSFRNTNIQAWIQQRSSATDVAIHIGNGCIVYNSDWQIEGNIGSDTYSFIKTEAGDLILEDQRTYITGSIALEDFSTTPQPFVDTAGDVLQFAGKVNLFNKDMKHGNLLLIRGLHINTDNSITRVKGENYASFTITANPGPADVNFGMDAGEVIEVTARIAISTSYDHLWTLLIERANRGSTTHAVLTATKHSGFQTGTSATGDPTFAMNGDVLEISNPSFVTFNPTVHMIYEGKLGRTFTGHFFD